AIGWQFSIEQFEQALLLILRATSAANGVPCRCHALSLRGQCARRRIEPCRQLRTDACETLLVRRAEPVALKTPSGCADESGRDHTHRRNPRDGTDGGLGKGHVGAVMTG